MYTKIFSFCAAVIVAGCLVSGGMTAHGYPTPQYTYTHDPYRTIDAHLRASSDHEVAALSWAIARLDDPDDRDQSFATLASYESDVDQLLARIHDIDAWQTAVADGSVTREVFHARVVAAVPAIRRILQAMSRKLAMIRATLTHPRPAPPCQELTSGASVDGYAVTYIEVHMGPRCRIVTSISASGESLASLVDRVGGTSGINGSYFCPKGYPECHGVNTSYSMHIQDFRIVSQYGDDTGTDGTVFAISATGSAFLAQKGYDYSHGQGDQLLSNRSLNVARFPEIRYGISNFPLLLSGGQNVLSDYESSLDAKMRADGTRNFICTKGNSSTVIIGSIAHATVYDVPSVLQSIGCIDALNLDSGGSTALMYDGQYLKGPGRDIMDAFVVVEGDGTGSR